jgi:hypothetical protein
LPLISKFKTIKCPDGTSRNILKDPHEAFKTEFSTWDAKVKTIINILNSKTDVDAEVKKKTEPIVQGLTETYATLQAEYCSAYLGYWSNPCSSETEKAWQAERNKIIEKQTILEKMEKKLVKPRKQVKKAKRKPSDERKIIGFLKDRKGSIEFEPKAKISITDAKIKVLENLVSDLSQ